MYDVNIFESKYLEDCLYNCLDTPGKKIHNFLISLSKITENHVLNKLKAYKRAPSLTQTFSVIKTNEQLLTNSQCNG